VPRDKWAQRFFPRWHLLTDQERAAYAEDIDNKTFDRLEDKKKKPNGGEAPQTA
jgi:hypothetical protein